MRRLSCIPFVMVLLLAALPASSQPRLGLGEHPTLNADVRDTHFIHLGMGNRYEYQVTHTENGEPADPAFLRFTVVNTFNPVAGADDFMVQVDVYDNERKIRQANCYMRLQRGRIHVLGASAMGHPDCNYQSPFSSLPKHTPLRRFASSWLLHSGHPRASSLLP
ncbi:MAG: hypothetical protein OXT73_08495 [Bacteroidota bacterium]|nr:hypothetical protein [Bacteroidota bacterium]